MVRKPLLDILLVNIAISVYVTNVSQSIHQGGTSTMVNVLLAQPNVWDQLTKKLLWTLKQTRRGGHHLCRSSFLQFVFVFNWSFSNPYNWLVIMLEIWWMSVLLVLSYHMLIYFLFSCPLLSWETFNDFQVGRFL